MKSIEINNEVTSCKHVYRTYKVYGLHKTALDKYKICSTCGKGFRRIECKNNPTIFLEYSI